MLLTGGAGSAEVGQTHLSLHIYVELLDTLEGKLFFLHQDANGISHELLGHLQHLCWHGGREQDHLEKIQNIK